MENTRESTIMSKFDKAKRKRQHKDYLWKELDAFDRGQQWDLSNSNLPSWVPRPVTNFIHLVKTTKRAALAIENPVGKLFGQGPEDHEKAKHLQKVYEFEWDRMKMRSIVRDSLDTSRLLGTAVVQMTYEENGVKGPKGSRYEGEIGARMIDPASFYPDPNAFTIDECEYIHVVYRKSLDWIKKHPIFKDEAKKIDSRDQASMERGEIYNRDYGSEKDGLVDFHEHYEKVANGNGGFNYKVTYLAAGVVLHTVERLEPNCYPFAVLYDHKQRQDFWGVSTCELILDNQKLINKVESIIAMIGTLMQNPQKVVSKGSGINPKEAAKYGMAPGHTWYANGDPSKAIHWQQPPQIPPTLFNLAEQAKANIREITGLTESYMGQSVGSLQTSQGVDSLIERSTMRDRDQMYDLELFIEAISVLMVKFITTKYDDRRFMRIVEKPNSEPRFESFIGTEYKDLQFDINVEVSSKAPITRARRKQELHQLLTLQGQMQFDPPLLKPQEYMEYSEFVDSDKLIDRMDRDETMNKVQILTEVATMMHEGMMQQLPPQEIQKMATQMIEQRLEQGNTGVGSTSKHSGATQARQGNPNV